MQYEIIATVRLVIIAEILGLIAAELRHSVQICNFSRHSSRKRSTTRQLLDIARNLASNRDDTALHYFDSLTMMPRFQSMVDPSASTGLASRAPLAAPPPRAIAALLLL